MKCSSWKFVQLGYPWTSTNPPRPLSPSHSPKSKGPIWYTSGKIKIDKSYLVSDFLVYFCDIVKYGEALIGFGIAVKDEGNVAPLPSHVGEVHEGRV